MAFNKTALAVMMSMTVSGGAAIAAPVPGDASNSSTQTDIRKAFSTETTGVYSITLKSPGSLDSSYFEAGLDKKAALAAIDSEQRALLSDIKMQDQTAFLKLHVRLVSNMIQVQMSHEAAKQFATHELVASMHEMQGEELSYTVEADFSGYPFHKMNDANGAVTVAIIGNGVDYTHALLGGKGTVDGYNEARENYVNAWDGFPNDVVIGGFDFASERSGFDYNPIEFDQDFQDWTGAQFTAGHGTLLASSILAQAPNAKILSYKTLGTTDWDRVYRDYRAYNYPALEMALDPNQDGDTSDRADIIIMDANGAGAFIAEGDAAPDGGSEEILLLRTIAAQGTLVVTPAGEYGEILPMYFNLAWRGATPEALTVGSVKMNGEAIVPSAFTPFGIVRGDINIKPDLMHFGEGVEAALVGSGTGTATSSLPRTQAIMAAGRAAGEAAAIMAAFPELSMLEIKALLVNTANADISGAEVPRIGAGLAQADVAVTSPALVWDASNYQPNLTFGFVSVLTNASITKDITIKNISDETQTYHLSTVANGDKQSNNALTWLMPESVVVPANRSVVFTVTLNISEDALAGMPIKETADYTLENWSQLMLNGYLKLTNADASAPVLSLPWLVMPKNAPFLDKDLSTVDFSRPTFSEEWAEGFTVEEVSLEFNNSTTSEQTYIALPLIAQNLHKRADQVQMEGNLINNVAGGIYPEALCESGYKLTVALNTFDNTDLPLAKHAERGWHQFAAAIYFPEMMEQITLNGVDGYDAQTLERYRQNFPEHVVTDLTIVLDDKMQPVTHYIDHDMEYDWTKPNARVRKSSLPTTVSPDGNTTVANVCVDELYHHEFNSVEQLDANLGFQFATDRHAIADAGEEVLQYNPVQFGSEIVYAYCPPMNAWACKIEMYPDQTQWPWYQVKAKEGFMPALAVVTGETELGEDRYGNEIEVPVYDYSHEITLAPGERGLFGLAIDLACNPGSIGYTENDEVNCYPGVMLANVATGYAITTKFGDKVGSVINAPLAGQAFSVYENAANDHLIGTLAMDSELFFGLGGSDSSPVEVSLVNAIPGTPFAVSVDGDITINNADAIDFEDNKFFTLTVRATQGNDSTPEVYVKISVTNVNDEAPMQVQTLATIVATQNKTVSADITASFRDPEGDGIAFSATDMPAGLSISTSGVISGTPTAAGDYSATVNLFDGANTSTATVNMIVTATAPETAPVIAAPVASAPVAPAPANPTASAPTEEASEDSSGGSLGGLLIAFLGLCAMTRRRL